MKRKYWPEIVPSLLVAAGIIAATFVAKRGGGTEWVALTGALVLALAIVAAGMLNSRLQGESSGPSWAALVLGSAVLLSSWIVARRDPGLVKTLIPLIGATSWVALLSREDDRRKACRSV